MYHKKFNLKLVIFVISNLNIAFKKKNRFSLYLERLKNLKTPNIREMLVGVNEQQFISLSEESIFVTIKLLQKEKLGNLHSLNDSDINQALATKHNIWSRVKFVVNAA